MNYKRFSNFSFNHAPEPLPRRRELSLSDMAARQKALRAKVQALAATKEQTLTAPDVDRVARVLALADGLLLKRDRIQALIEQQGFEVVEATLQTLANQKALTGTVTHPFFGTLVKSLDTSEFERLVTQRKVSKNLATERDSFFGDLYKRSIR